MGLNIGEGKGTNSLVLDRQTIFNNYTDKKFAIIDSVDLKKTNETDKPYIRCVMLCKGGLKIYGYRFNSNDILADLDLMTELVGQLVSVYYVGNIFKDDVSIRIDTISELAEQPQEIIDMFYQREYSNAALTKSILSELTEIEQKTKEVLVKTILPKLGNVVAGEKIVKKGIYLAVLSHCLKNELLNEEQKEILALSYSLLKFRGVKSSGEHIYTALSNVDKINSEYKDRIKTMILKLSGCNVELEKADTIIPEVIQLYENLIE